ncbi:MAG: DnaJ domain-containing protein [Spirochaetes bacterium]|nr:DnaJ domain-containing protein [Spirochaetota bacterium]
MGKLIGMIIGSVLGPLGAFFGFIIGAVFDSLHIRKASYYYFNFDSDSILEESFPVLAAAITRAGGVAKESVLATKNIAVQLLGVEKASKVMKIYKNLCEKQFSMYILQNICDNILYNVDYQSKIYIISLLLAIIKARNVFSLDEVYAIEKIARAIGISVFDFETLLRNYRTRSGYYQSDFSSGKINQSDPYDVLGVKIDDSVEDIKKQYRALCKKYHPDLTQNLPEKEREESKIKMKEIINAYDRIKKERKFN